MQNRFKFYLCLSSLFALVQTGYAQNSSEKKEPTKISMKHVAVVTYKQHEPEKNNSIECPWPCGGGLQIMKVKAADCPWPCGGKKGPEFILTQSDQSQFLQTK